MLIDQHSSSSFFVVLIDQYASVLFGVSKYLEITNILGSLEELLYNL